MIKGLLFEIDSEELKHMFEARAKHHEKKANYFAERAGRAEEEPPADLVSNRTVMSAKRDFLRRADLERQEASRFKFLAEHLIEKEIYQLTWEEIQKLEIREVIE